MVVLALCCRVALLRENVQWSSSGLFLFLEGGSFMSATCLQMVQDESNDDLYMSIYTQITYIQRERMDDKAHAVNCQQLGNLGKGFFTLFLHFF
jgi:hypothetical protein